MIKNRFVFGLVFILMLVFISNGYVDAFQHQVAVNKLFFSEGQGYWWNVQFDLVRDQGFYLEGLTVGDFYQQKGAGIELLIFDKPKLEVRSLVGLEQYRFNETKNSFFRAGLKTKMFIYNARVSLGGDVMVDDLVGIFPRYYVEVGIINDILTLGVGNLLGNKDGQAFWVGIHL